MTTININELNGKIIKAGEAISAEVNVWRKYGKTKVYFNLSGNCGKVTWDVDSDKWYGPERVIPTIKNEIGI